MTTEKNKHTADPQAEDVQNKITTENNPSNEHNTDENESTEQEPETKTEESSDVIEDTETLAEESPESIVDPAPEPDMSAEEKSAEKEAQPDEEKELQQDISSEEDLEPSQNEEKSDEEPAADDVDKKIGIENVFDKFLDDLDRQWTEIDPSGHLMLKDTDVYSGRKIADVNESNAEEIIAKLKEQYEKARAEVDGLSSKMEVENDHVVLYPEVTRLMKYLSTINAIGDLPSLMNTLNGLETKIVASIDSNMAKLKQVLDRFKEHLDKPIDSIKESDQNTKALLEEWKAVGKVPREKKQGLSDELRQLQDQYTIKRRERLRQLDYEYLNNLDRKREIIEKAKAVLEAKQWKEGHRQMQDLFTEWKSIGRVPRDMSDVIWEEFRSVKNEFYRMKNEHYDEIFSGLEENLEAKNKIVDEIESIKESSDWNKTTKAILDLDKQFGKIGRVPEENKKELLDRLHAAKNYFFDRRKVAYEAMKGEMQENLIIKEDLANKAEAVQDSTDWKNATRIMNQLFDEWKATGPAFRSKEQKIWKRFISARKHFYNRKDAFFENLNKKRHKENILRVESEKQRIKNLQAEMEEDQATLQQLKTDYETEQNDRFKSKIKETIDFLEKKLAQDQKEIIKTQSWIDKTEAIEKKEEQEAEKEQNAESEVAENALKEEDTIEEEVAEKEEKYVQEATKDSSEDQNAKESEAEQEDSPKNEEEE